jgi:quercetin dioxygenase-like cupin family protein
MTTTRTILICGVTILAMIAVYAAEKPVAKFSELQRRDIPGTGLQGVTTVAEIPPGVTSARHSHPGQDFGYLIEGTIVLYVDGKPPITLKAGDVFFTERGQIHNARNIGTTTARAVDTYVIDTGKPGITPAP